MADSKTILSKRWLRRHVKKGPDAALAALHSHRPTHLCPAADTELPPPVANRSNVPASFETLSDVDGIDGDWFMASDVSASSSEDDFDFDDLPSCSSSEEGDSLFPDDNRDFRRDLKAWVVSTNTPISHISSLLSELRKHFPNSNLPKDGRILLSTPTYSEVVSTAGGEMHYFGVANGVLGRMREHTGLTEHQALKLQINVDGLPLFKSSSQQFWPTLGIIEENPTRTPFIINVYCG